jgi:hypothetical protein
MVLRHRPSPGTLPDESLSPGARNQHGQTWGQIRERLAQRRATLGHQQFLFLTRHERLAGAL